MAQTYMHLSSGTIPGETGNDDHKGLNNSNRFKRFICNGDRNNERGGRRARSTCWLAALICSMMGPQ